MQNPDTLLEAAILSEIISGSTLTDRIFTELMAENFNDPKNRAIFQTLQNMYGARELIDILTVRKRLENLKDIPGIVEYLNTATEHITTPAHIIHYIGIIRRNSYLRKIRNEIINLNPEAKSEQIEQIMTLIQLRDSGEKPLTVTPMDFIDGYINDLKTKKYDGIETGFTILDTRIRAQSTDLIIVGARTNVGKTTFLTNVLVNMLQADIPCLYCPTEMRPAQFVDRIAPLLVSVPADKFRSRDFDLSDFDKIGEIGKLVGGMPLTLLDVASPNISEIRMAVKSSGCKVLFLDYLGRCSMPKESTRMREIEKFMVELKNICVELGVLCFLAVQLSRATDFNKDTAPRLADLSDSSAIEKEADAVVFLWRDPKDEGSYAVSKISGLIAKNRHGRLDSFGVDFNKTQMRMSQTAFTPQGDWNEKEPASF